MHVEYSGVDEFEGGEKLRGTKRRFRNALIPRVTVRSEATSCFGFGDAARRGGEESARREEEIDEEEGRSEEVGDFGRL